MRKGQVASMEMILIVGVVLVTTIPLGVWAIDGLNQKWSEGIKLQEAVTLRNAIETVSRLGSGNSMAVASVNGYSIIDNHIIHEDLIDVPLLPSIGDNSAGEGVIEIINTGGDIFFGNAPTINYIDVNDKSNIRIIGEHFSQDTVVFLDSEETSSIFLDESEIDFDLWKAGKFNVQLIRIVGDKELTSTIVEIQVKGGGPIEKKGKKK